MAWRQTPRRPRLRCPPVALLHVHTSLLLSSGRCIARSDCIRPIENYFLICKLHRYPFAYRRKSFKKPKVYLKTKAAGSVKSFDNETIIN